MTDDRNIHEPDVSVPVYHRIATQRGENIAKTVVMVLPDHRVASRHPRFDLYSSLFGYDHDDNLRFYGAYRHGQLVGYGAVRLNGQSEPEVLMVDAVRPRTGVGSAILSLMQTHYDSFYTHADSKAGERLMARHGMVNVEGHRWRWAKGQEPKDMLDADVPFLYDAQRNWIEIGYPGQSTHDITNRKGFTAGAIVEGYYQPGGKILLLDSGVTMPYTTHQLAKTWYHRFPQMRIQTIERERGGKTHKIAASNVGAYIRSTLPTDPPAYAAYQALRDAGGKVYAVGGAIRDALQQREPNDMDLMVAGLPDEQVAHVLESLPGRVDLTGKRFGVYRYKIGGRDVEIALPRTDKYGDEGQRGKGVITTDPNLPVEKDLERRDFTANAMAVDLDTGQLIDPYNGAHDSENHILRTTHPDSFHDDPSRLVRALAMHGRFGLNPDERTRREMETHGHMLRAESPDTINKILTEKVFGPKNGNPAGSMRLARETGLLKHLFPKNDETWEHDQNNSHHAFKLGEHHLQALDRMSQLTDDPDERMAAFNHDIGKPDSEWVDPATGESHYYAGPNGMGANHEEVGASHHEDQLRALNFPVARINKQVHIVRHHMFPAFNSPKGARKFLNRVGDENADMMLRMREADMEGKGQGPEYFDARTPVDQMRELVNQARTQQAPTALQNLSVNGNDLIQMGMKPGPAIGAILNQLMQDVVDNPQLNQRDALLQRAQQYVAAQPA